MRPAIYFPTQATTQATALSGRASFLPLSYDTRIVLPLHAHQHIIVSKQGIQDMLFKAGILRRFAIQAGFEESFIQKRPHRIVEVIHFYLNLENIPSSVMSAITSILLPFPVYFHALNGCSKPEFQDSYPEPVEFDKLPEVPWAGHSFKKLSGLEVETGILKQETENNSQRHETVEGPFIASQISPEPGNIILWHYVKMENLHVWTPESSPYYIAGCETALYIKNTHHSGISHFTMSLDGSFTRRQIARLPTAVRDTQQPLKIPELDHTPGQRPRDNGVHRIWEPIITEQVEHRKKQLSDFADLNDFCIRLSPEFSRRGSAEAEVLVLWSSNPENVLPDALSIDSIPPFATIAHLSSFALDVSCLDTGSVIRTSTGPSKVIWMDFGNVVNGGAQDVQTLSFCPVTGQPTSNDSLSLASESTVCKLPEETPNNNLSVDSEPRVCKSPEETSNNDLNTDSDLSTVCKLPEETPNDNSNIDSESTVCKPSEEIPCPSASSSESTASKPPGKTPWYTRLYHLLPGQGKKN
ncbi:hypothetical protein H0H93_007953 [Arthromyces matolae]|nr:hypothetical protein H0H93_007953 [Arthromyces matolae]